VFSGKLNFYVTRFHQELSDNKRKKIAKQRFSAFLKALP
jgi:hypothetical protein